jgi:hypothetical protein
MNEYLENWFTGPSKDMTYNIIISFLPILPLNCTPYNLKIKNYIKLTPLNTFIKSNSVIFIQILLKWIFKIRNMGLFMVSH